MEKYKSNRSMFLIFTFSNFQCTMISFSPDERLFATSTKNNRIVKVWFQTKVKEKEDFSYIYLPHQRAVTSFEWRPIPKTKKF